MLSFGYFNIFRIAELKSPCINQNILASLRKLLGIFPGRSHVFCVCFLDCFCQFRHVKYPNVALLKTRLSFLLVVHSETDIQK